MYHPHRSWLLAVSTALGLFACAEVAALAAPAEDDYAAAAALYAAGRWPEAAGEFARFVDLHSDHPRVDSARFFRAESLVQAGQHDEAVTQHEEFLRHAPGHHSARVARFRIGECLLLAGKNDEAQARLEEFRRQFPADDLNSFALAYLGEIAQAAGKNAIARDHFAQALRDFPNSPLATDASYGLARCDQADGKLAAAMARFEQIARNHDHPLADDARLQIGICQFQLQQFAAGEESLSSFRTTFAESEVAPLAWYWLARCQVAGGQPATGAATFAAAAKQFAASSHAADLHAAAAEAFRLAKDNAQADWHYQRLLADWPQSQWADDALFSRVELALEANDAERATAIASELARRFPDSPHAAVARLIPARKLLAEQNFAAAEQLLTAAGGPSAEASQNGEREHLLILAQLGQQNYAAALATIEQLPMLAADDPRGPARDEARCAALLGLGRHDEALDLLRAQLTRAESDPAKAAAIRSQLVVALTRTGQSAAAIEEIEQLQADAVTNPDIATAVLLAAEEAYRAGNLPTAERLFNLASQRGVPAEQRTQALSGLAWTQYRLAGKLASAATFDRLLREYPTSPLAAEAALARARSLEEAGQAEAAIATYRLAIEKYATSPQLPQALWGAARLHDKLDQDRDAAALLTRLIDEFPQFVERDAALYVLSWVQTDLQSQPAAEKALEQLTKEYPHSAFWADAAYRLAEQAARSKQTSRAIELADAILAAKVDDKTHENTLYLRGQLAAAQSQWPDAARFMQDHVARFPNSPVNLSARYWQAEAAFRQGDYKAAEKQLADLDLTAKARDDSWLGIVPLRRAQCLAQENRWTEALRMAQTVATRYPQFKQQFEVDYLIGRALGNQGRFDDARLAYARVLKSTAAAGTETAALAQWMTGEACFHQKRYAEAIAAYEKCASGHAFPRWQAAALLQAGKCRILLGETDQARRDLERVVNQFPGEPSAQEASTRLAALPAAESATIQTAEKPR